MFNLKEKNILSRKPCSKNLAVKPSNIFFIKAYRKANVMDFIAQLKSYKMSIDITL